MDKEQTNKLTRRELIIEMGKWSRAVGVLTLGTGAVYGLNACGGGGGDDSGSTSTTYCNITYCNGCCHNYSAQGEATCYCNYSDYSDTCCG